MRTELDNAKRKPSGALAATLAAAVIGAMPAIALGTWSDNFDSYNTVTKLPNQSSWEAWAGAASAGNFYATTAQSLSPQNSVEINGPDDAVHRYSGHTSGVWEYTAWVYVPGTMNDVQMFILLNTYPAGPLSDWSLQLNIDGGNGSVWDHTGTGSAPLVFDQWALIRVEIDLDNDTQNAFYNGNFIATKSWTAGFQPGGAVNIGAVDLWANNSAHTIYYDDLNLRPFMEGIPSFSVDFQGPMMAMPDSFWGFPITEADILIPAPPTFAPAPGPLPPPATVIFGGPGAPGPKDLGLALYPPAVGHPAGQPGHVEVDALSYGTDFNLDPSVPWAPMWSFSVDEFAMGMPGVGGPSVGSEGMVGVMEASADIFVDWFIGPGPFPPPPPFVFGNTDIIDGDGIPPFGGFGVGLFEPNFPAPSVPDMGDNLDAVDVDELIGPHTKPIPVYFSLDTCFPDPLEGPPVNSASALAHGFVGGDVLVSLGGGAPPIVYAPAPVLGLDREMGPDTDDLDALILWENGDGQYQPSQQPFDWHSGATDMLLFSVRRGSFVIGMPDSMWGVPIEEGDILCPPVVGGASPFPGIMIPAEQLGLATLRSGMQTPTGFADDLDAADLSPDCNANQMPDMLDIITGASSDVNNDGIPDECQCPEDLNGDRVVDVLDLLILLGAWGGGGAADINGDGVVDVLDLLQLLGAWGPC